MATLQIQDTETYPVQRIGQEAREFSRGTIARDAGELLEFERAVVYRQSVICNSLP
jgi:hypothetical protein